MSQHRRDDNSQLLSAAEFSNCRKYRYQLYRTWNTELPAVLFVGLNPSTADATSDDPTVRRCIGFARKWGFGTLILTNLFAYRSTNPVRLSSVRDPIGPENDRWIAQARDSASLVIAAWGTHGSLKERDQEVFEMLPDMQCLGRTKAGAPRHPLYLAANTRLRPYRG